MATETKPGDPCVIVVFGAAGDLTKRKLLPALYNLRGHGLLPKDFAVVGVARKDFSTDAFRAEQSEDIRKFATTPVDDAVWADFNQRLYYVSGEFGNPETYRKLGTLLAEIQTKHATKGNVLFYLSTPPSFFEEIVKQLGGASLVTEEGGAWRRVIIEKPFGHDLDSAVALNKSIRAVLAETQIYRIDHYLGKETVQNILVLRFANGILEPVWNRRYIDHVQILVAESIGVEGRGNYYDQSGVLRDMIQNHMFQLLSLVAMEPPISFQATDVRNEKVKVLNAIHPMTPEEVLTNSVRGQYGPGPAEDPGYRREKNVSPTSNTETYAALKLFVENWRWADVPFYLRSGKKLAKRSTEIVIQFRRAPLLLFRHTIVDAIEPNRLVLHIQPNEGITMEIEAKIPGPTVQMKSVKLDFSYKDFGEAAPSTGYETLLYDCMVGDTALFHRADMVEAAWSIANPILDVWKSLPARDFPNYAGASWGPASADQLMQKDGRRWINP
ncbi:MAG: glucose-6-phosphate dehydrogenase [Acidobacteria bacterium]|nr:glucose-6-phosphate dehydrogenase [Acidobacteriota bacterium]